MSKPRKFTDLRWKMGSPEMVLVFFDEKKHKVLGVTKSVYTRTVIELAHFVADEVKPVGWDYVFDDYAEENFRFGKTWYSTEDIYSKTSAYCTVVQFKNVEADYGRYVKRHEVFKKYKNRETTKKCRRKHMILKFLKAYKDISFLDACDPSCWFWENRPNMVNKKDDDWE